MPQIPRYLAQQAPGGLPQSMRARAAPVFGINLAPVAQALDGLAVVEAKLSQAARGKRVRDQVLVANRSLAELDVELAGRTDYEAHPGLVKERQAQIIDQAKESFGGDVAAFETWRGQVEPLLLRNEAEIRARAAKAHRESQAVDVQRQLAQLSEAAAMANGEAADLLLNEGLVAIGDAVAAGIISEADGFKAETKYKSDVIANRVRQDLLADPVSAQRKLAGGGYAGLTADERTQFLGQAQRRVEAEENRAIAAENRQWRDEERARAANERAVKDAQEAREAEIFDRVLADPRAVRETDIAEMVRTRQIRPEQGRTALGMLREETEATDDPSIIIDLQTRIDSGQLAGVQDDIGHYAIEGRLKPGTARTLLGDLNDARQGGPNATLMQRADVQQAVRDLADIIGERNSLGMMPTASAEKFRAARETLVRRLRENRNADVQQLASEIIQTAKGQQQRPAFTGSYLPRGSVTADSVNRAFEALEADREKLTPSQYATEMEALQSWLEWLRDTGDSR